MPTQVRAEERHRRKGHWAGRDGATKTSAAAQAHIPAPHLLLQRCERLAAVGFRGRRSKGNDDDDEAEEEDECPRTWGSASGEKIACTSPPANVMRQWL